MASEALLAVAATPTPLSALASPVLWSAPVWVTARVVALPVAAALTRRHPSACGSVDGTTDHVVGPRVWQRGVIAVVWLLAVVGQQQVRRTAMPRRLR